MSTGAPPSRRGNTVYFKALLEHIREKLDEVSEGSVKDGKDFITYKRLEEVWQHKRQGDGGASNLEDFEFFMGPDALPINLSKHLRFISTLISIHWDHWQQFESTFGAALENGILDGLEKGEPLSWDVVAKGLHPTFSGWSKNFYPRQFVFIPIIIGKKQDVEDYDAHTRLPLLRSNALEAGDTEMRSGFFGKVYRVAVAEGQYQISTDEMNTKPKIVALKTFHSKSDFAFEKRNLEALLNCRRKHDHIAFHLTALSIGSEFHIFSQWAELDLQKLLNGKYKEHMQDKDFTPWALTLACQCLASALHFLHTELELGLKDAYCCHLDLKPNNILIYRDESDRHPLGIWKISDFGISQLKQKSGEVDNATSSGRLSSPTIPRRHAAEFQPPENEDDGMFYSGRKVDIWSFGCILLTIFAFSQAGPAGVRALFDRKKKCCPRHQCNYFYCGDTNPDGKMSFFPKQAISEWVDECLHSHGTSRNWARDWLILVTKGMLVIEGRQRQSAKEVGDKLTEIFPYAPDKYTGWGLTTATSTTAPLTQTHSWRQQNSSGKQISPDTETAPAEVLEDPSKESLSQIKAGKRPERIVTSPSRSAVERDEDLSPHAESRLVASPTQLPRSSTMELPTSSHGASIDIPLSRLSSASARTFSTHGLNSEDSRSGSSSEFNKNLEVIKHELPGSIEGVKGMDLTYAGDRVAIRFKDSVLLYGRSSAQERPSSSQLKMQVSIPGRWDEFCIAGQFVALKGSTSDTPKFRLVRVIDDKMTDCWQSLPDIKALLGFDVSCQGSVILRFKNKLQVYDSNAIKRLEYPEGGLLSSDPFEAAAFSRDGKRLVALAWKLCQAWELREDNSFKLCFSQPHQLRNIEWSSFRPQLIPFTTRAGAIVHNPTEKSVRILDESGSFESSVSGDVLRMALTPNDERLVIVRDTARRDSQKNSKTRKRTNNKFRGLTHAPTLQGTEGPSIGDEDPPLLLEMRSDKSKSIRLVVGPDTGPWSIWLVSDFAEVREIPFTT